MITLYKKLYGRKYEQLKEHEFSGFPVDGIWMVSGNGQSFICSKKDFSLVKVSFCIFRDEIIRKLFDTNNSMMESLLAVVSSVKVEELNRERKVSNVEILYQKTNKRYSKYGESFIGFPHSGIFEVYDGRNNGIKFLGHFSDFPVLNVNILKTMKIPQVSSEDKTYMEYVAEFLLRISEEYEKISANELHRDIK